MHLVVFLYALFASLFTLQKDALSYAEPFFLVGSRMTFAGILLLTYLVIINRRLITFNLKHLPLFVLLGVINIYLTNSFEVLAIDLTISSKVCLIYSLSPFLAALVAFVVLKEKMSKKKWLGMVISFFGLLPILFSRPEEEIIYGVVGMFSRAEQLAIFAVFCSVCGWVVLKKLVSELKYSPLFANGFSMLVGGILTLAHSYLSCENWQPVPVTSVQPFIVNSLIMCLISNIICYNLYGLLLKRFSVTFMSLGGLITPIFAALFGFLFLDEIITWHFFASICLFFLGLIFFLQEEIRIEKYKYTKPSLLSDVI